MPSFYELHPDALAERSVRLDVIDEIMPPGSQLRGFLYGSPEPGDVAQATAHEELRRLVERAAELILQARGVSAYG